MSGFSRDDRFGSKSSKVNQIGQLTSRARETSWTTGSETSSGRRSDTSLQGSELSLEDNSVFSSNLVNQTSNPSPADYDLSTNLSHPEEMVVDRENERKTEPVGEKTNI